MVTLSEVLLSGVEHGLVTVMAERHCVQHQVLVQPRRRLCLVQQVLQQCFVIIQFLVFLGVISTWKYMVSVSRACCSSAPAPARKPSVMLASLRSYSSMLASILQNDLVGSRLEESD